MFLVRSLSTLLRLDPWNSLFMILLWGKDIHPSYDKAYSALLGTQPVEGLVLSQSTWAKSENSFRLMAAAGSLL